MFSKEITLKEDVNSVLDLLQEVNKCLEMCRKSKIPTDIRGTVGFTTNKLRLCGALGKESKAVILRPHLVKLGAGSVWLKLDTKGKELSPIAIQPSELQIFRKNILTAVTLVANEDNVAVTFYFGEIPFSRLDHLFV